MSFIDTTCPHCGSNINVDADKNKGFCQYCGAELMIQELAAVKIKVDKSDDVKKLEKSLTEAIEDNMYGNESYANANKLLEIDDESFIARYVKVMSMYDSPLVSGSNGGNLFYNSDLGNPMAEFGPNKFTSAVAVEMKKVARLVKTEDELCKAINLVCKPFEFIAKSLTAKGCIVQKLTNPSMEEMRNVVTLDTYLVPKLKEVFDVAIPLFKQNANLESEAVRNTITNRLTVLVNILGQRGKLKQKYAFAEQGLRSLLGEDVVIPQVKDNKKAYKITFFSCLCASIILLIVAIVTTNKIDNSVIVSDGVFALAFLSYFALPPLVGCSIAFGVMSFLVKKK